MEREIGLRKLKHTSYIHYKHQNLFPVVLALKFITIMQESASDNPKEAYNISNYDLVYILLKPAAHIAKEYKDIVKYDKGRDKWFLTGKVIEAIGYPKYRTLAFILEKNLPEYKKARKFEDKRKYILNIPFSYIDFITLPFDSFDWKK